MGQPPLAVGELVVGAFDAAWRQKGFWPATLGRRVEATDHLRFGRLGGAAPGILTPQIPLLTEEFRKLRDRSFAAPPYLPGAAPTTQPEDFDIEGRYDVTLVKVAAGQTIRAGDAVRKDANGDLILALATDANLYGIAAAAGAPRWGDFEQTTAQRGDYVPVYANAGELFVGRCSGTLAAADVPRTADIEGGSGAMEVNEDASLTGVLRIVGFIAGEADVAMTGANALVTFTIAQKQV